MLRGRVSRRSTGAEAGGTWHAGLFASLPAQMEEGGAPPAPPHGSGLSFVDVRGAGRGTPLPTSPQRRWTSGVGGGRAGGTPPQTSPQDGRNIVSVDKVAQLGGGGGLSRIWSQQRRRSRCRRSRGGADRARSPVAWSLS